jgi:hypothetical protein
MAASAGVRVHGGDVFRQALQEISFAVTFLLRVQRRPDLGETSSGEVPMKKLELEGLDVESFTTEPQAALVAQTPMYCTGCDSTCGIIAPDFSEICY